MWYVVEAVALLGLCAALYFAFAPGPRLTRAYRRAKQCLDSGDWQETLRRVQPFVTKRLAEVWKARFQQLAGQAHQLAIDARLKDKQFAQALEHARQSAQLLDLEVAEQERIVVDGVLAEIRRLFAAGPSQSEALRQTVNLAANLAQKQLPEATFWLAMLALREGHLEEAQQLLVPLLAHESRTILDVPLYLGIVQHRLGKPQDALRSLAEANRIDPNCPFVPWQMGISMMASNGDSGLAMRALQRALGLRGLGQWQSHPERLWVEAMPEGKSWVRRLATRHRFVCPLLGEDLTVILRQGQLALAQAYYRQEKFQEAADLYGKLMQDAPPTLLLMRGYGLSLARLGQHDQAYKHLRLALEQEDPKDPFTAGYLALCGAMGKPIKAEDKARNLIWALRLMAKHPLLGNAEWTQLVTAVYSEARKHSVAIPREELIFLCEVLAAVQAHDARAALAYSQLAEQFPEAIQPIHAWLYARACAVHQVTSRQDLPLLEQVFSRSAEARAYFERHGWDFREVEYTYLARFAAHAPGRFPEILGPDYPAHGEAFLLKRSVEQESAGQGDPAVESVEVLLKLSPTNLAAHDRLACLHYRRGNLERSLELLDGWRKLAPRDHWPLVRRAVLEQARGDTAKLNEAIESALKLTQGRLRASIAFLGARLALRDYFRDKTSLETARRLLQEVLRIEPEHPQALWCLAAVLLLQDDQAGLTDLAPRLNNPTVEDARFHFLGAIAHLRTGQLHWVGEMVGRAARDRALEIESRFLLACARLRLGDQQNGLAQLRKVAEASATPSRPYALAMLGRLCLLRGEVDEAVRWWSALEPPWRSKWGLDEPLQRSVLAAGLQALQAEQFEQAAERFREASRLGLRDKRLAGLISLALVKAGQRLLYQEAKK